MGVTAKKQRLAGMMNAFYAVSKLGDAITSFQKMIFYCYFVFKKRDVVDFNFSSIALARIVYFGELKQK